MKKIIIAIISAMILMPTMANAQIQKTGTFKTQTISSVRLGFVNLRLNDSGMYYLAMKTDNQFDYHMIVKLGYSKEAAIQSLNNLINVLDSLDGKTTQYIYCYGDQFRLWKLMGALYISADGYAGSANIGKSELKKFVKVLGKIK